MKVTILFWKLMEKQPNGSINIRRSGKKGYLGEFSIAGGTNYKDKLYLGAVLGIQWTYDKQRILYSEIAEENAPHKPYWIFHTPVYPVRRKDR